MLLFHFLAKRVMKAIVCESFDHPSLLTLTEQPDPELADHQVLIDVAATGLGYVDALTVSGLYQIKPPLPFVPGNEIAGTILATGSQVVHLKPGDRVLAMPSQGGLAERISVSADRCHKISDRLDFAAAASFLVNYCTAYHGLITCGEISASDTVLVLGASGGVGMAAIDLAKSQGAFVIAAASTEEKQAAALTAGADLSIDYSQPAWRDALKQQLAGRPLTVVYDPVGGDFADPALRSLAPSGRYLVVGFASGKIPSIAANLTLLKQIRVIGVNWGGFIGIHPEASEPVIQSLLNMTTEGKLNPIAGHRFALEQAGEAMTTMLERRAIGKVVITQE